MAPAPMLRIREKLVAGASYLSLVMLFAIGSAANDPPEAIATQGFARGLDPISEYELDLIRGGGLFWIGNLGIEIAADESLWITENGSRSSLDFDLAPAVEQIGSELSELGSPTSNLVRVLENTMNDVELLQQTEITVRLLDSHVQRENFINRIQLEAASSIYLDSF